jgi:hypothetical protein|tara:strand:+ start:1727 stop:1927 length:201 start_codon:yes stop_codon:yes gene_type:complete
MRTIRVGDKVQAFLDSDMCGTVQEIVESKQAPWLVGGASQRELHCIILKSDGTTVRCAMGELHHTD